MTPTPGQPPADRTQFTYSIVIPVYNSEQLVGTTVDRVAEVIAEKARTTPHVVALDMLKNYGQHHANLAGLRESTGGYAITMDDDLQNHPTRRSCSSTRR